MVRFATLVFAATSAAAMAYSPRNAGAGDLLSSVGGKPKPAQSELNSMTVEQVTDVCGENLELNCCNEETTTINAAGESTGVLSNLFGDDAISLLDKCTPINVLLLNGLLQNQCNQKVACCDAQNEFNGGLVNAGLPCIALGSLV